jgi:hypothetical protein
VNRSIYCRAICVFPLVAHLIVGCSSAATSAPASSCEKPKILSETNETELALEALPAVMRGKAGVWVLRSGGFHELRPSRNGYTCIVNRDEIESIKPTCYDEEGTASILPVSMFFGNQMMACLPVPEIRDRIKQRYADGTFRSPRRAGIAFMMSPRIVNAHTMPDGTKMNGTAPPHYMIYAPNVTNEMLKLPPEAYREMPWLPYVAYDGPAGFLIITIPEEKREDHK